MKNFLRSLKYLKPYRFRLAVAVVCVLFIAVLWGGGLAMIVPGAKILISPEGLHGWAWISATQDRFFRRNGSFGVDGDERRGNSPRARADESPGCGPRIRTRAPEVLAPTQVSVAKVDEYHPGRQLPVTSRATISAATSRGR